MSSARLHVYDTCATDKQGKTHCDVLTTDEITVLRSSKGDSAGPGKADQPVKMNRRRSCHSEPLLILSSEQQTRTRE